MKSVCKLIVIVMALVSMSMGIPKICGAVSSGDVNGDGVVNVFDALLTLQYSVGLIEHTPVNDTHYLATADVAPLSTICNPQGDRTVNVFDALAILRHSVGLDPWNGTCPLPAVYSITGTITASGAALSGVQVSTVGHSTSTQINGAYALSGLSGGNYAVTPLKSGYSFTPQTTSVTIASVDVPLVNFSATTVAMQSVTVNSGGSTDASTANYVYHLQSSSSDYTYRIANFGINDQLIFPAGRAISVDNPDFTDGKVVLYLLSAGGGIISVELTNLTPVQDGKIFSVTSINALFGPGTVTQQ